jgi:hypothetical protein
MIWEPDTQLLDVIRGVQARAVHQGKSGFARRVLYNDQVSRNLPVLKHKRHIEVRWLSLYHSLERDFMLQNSLMRIYSTRSEIFIAAKKGQKTSLRKLQPNERDYSILGDFLGVLREDQMVCFALQEKHVTLGQAQHIVMQLIDKMNPSSNFKFSCPVLTEVGSDKKNRVVTPKLKSFQELCEGVKTYVKMHFRNYWCVFLAGQLTTSCSVPLPI